MIGKFKFYNIPRFKYNFYFHSYTFQIFKTQLQSYRLLFYGILILTKGKRLKKQKTINLNEQIKTLALIKDFTLVAIIYEMKPLSLHINS